MNNVNSIALRLASRLQLRPSISPCFGSHIGLLGGSHVLITSSRQQFHHQAHDSFSKSSIRNSPCLKSTKFSTTSRSSFHNTFVAQKLQAYDTSKQEQGLAFSKGELTADELRHVFGYQVPPPRFANRLLRVVHGRRIDGTLDLDPPPDMQLQLSKYPHATSDALSWLRQNHPVDEDAAILARIEREEMGEDQESPAELIQRGEDLGLYAPQSGRYRAKLSEEEGNVFGQSELDKIRAENIAQAEKEDEELQAQIDKIQADVKEVQVKALALKPEQGLEAASQEMRPPNDFERWVLKSKNRAQSEFALDSPEIMQSSLRSRLLPSFIFVALVCAGSYLYAQWWTPPRRGDRIFPNVSLSFSTIATIMALNVTIYLAWGFPPLWRVLNKYFIATPAYPRALSMLGNVFSHQSGKHLLYNMAGLLIFGLSLHEDIGRGNFVGIYLASGILGSFASLTNFALRQLWTTSSLGASGSVWGIATAYCWIHAHEKFSFVFIPSSWQETIQFQGWQFLALMAASQVVGFFSPLKSIDYTSHIAGIVVGLAAAEYWKRKRAKEDPLGVGGLSSRKSASKRWYETVLGKKNSRDE